MVKFFKLIKAESIYKRGVVIKRRFLLVLDKFTNGIFTSQYHYRGSSDNGKHKVWKVPDITMSTSKTNPVGPMV